MRFKDILGLSIALILAVGVAFLTRFFLEEKEKPKVEVAPQQQQITQVLIAGKTLKEGDKVKSGDLVWQQWPPAAMNKNYVTPQTLSTSSLKLEDLTGYIAREPIREGEPIIIKSFIKQGDKSILAAILTPGKRAVSIEVSATTASSGLINPGDIVDIILSYSNAPTPEGGSKATKSTTLFEGIKVLAIDANLSTPEDKEKASASPKVATLEVTPEQAEVLAGSVKEGVLSLSLHSLEKSNSSSLASEKAQPDTNAPEQTKVTIIRGNDISTLEFEINQ